MIRNLPQRNEAGPSTSSQRQTAPEETPPESETPEVEKLKLQTLSVGHRCPLHQHGKSK